MIGLALLGFAIYAYVDPNVRVLRSANPESQNITEVALYVLMGVGVITVLVGTFGCCGAYHESECLLGTYFTCVLIIFIAESTVVCLGLFVYENTFKSILRDYIASLSSGYHINSKKAKMMDRIQQNVSCDLAYTRQ